MRKTLVGIAGLCVLASCSNRVEVGADTTGWLEEVPADGRSWKAFVGDVNGDGRDDAVTLNDEEGSFDIVFGSPLERLDEGSQLRLMVCQPQHCEANTVSGLGDINGDGFDDVAVDSRVVLGGPGNETLELRNTGPHPSRVIESGADHLHALGDLDGDGFDDVLLEVGGDAAIVRGRASWTGFSDEEPPHDAIRLPMAQDWWWRLVGAGDINGDGHDDLALGVPGGTVAFTSGAALPWGATLSEEALAQDLGGVDAPEDQSDFETAAGDGVPAPGVFPVGDIDGDGFDDLVVGHMTYAEQPVSYLVWGADGSRLRHRAELDAGIGGVRIDGTAATVVGAGDLDRDGQNDLVFGAVGERVGHFGFTSDGWPTFSSLSTNAVRVVPGESLELSPSGGAALPRPPEARHYGLSVSVGDFDGDGVRDLVVEYAVVISEGVGERDGALFLNRHP